MDQHLGSSITLSFALVVLFAIVLYPSEHRPNLTATPEVSSVPAHPPEPPSSPAEPPPPLTPVEDLPTPAPAPAQAPAPTPAPVQAPVERLEPAVPARVEGKPGPAAAAVPRAPAPSLPRVAVRAARKKQTGTHDAFTRAEEGETLRDVAIRVYGSPDAFDTLWRLNRDLVGRRDAPLPAGTLLRTP
jgi:outer membrane biosynthesis protein TonB